MRVLRARRLSALLGTINKVKSALNPALELEGLVLTMFDARNRLSHEIAHEVKKHFPEKVFQSVIPRSVRLSESPSHGLSVIEYGPSRRARRLSPLAAEIVARGEERSVMGKTEHFERGTPMSKSRQPCRIQSGPDLPEGRNAGRG